MPRPITSDTRQASGPPIAGGAYPDLGAVCAVKDFVKETTAEQNTDVITFATPSTSPERVAMLVARASGTALWGARAVRY